MKQTKVIKFTGASAATHWHVSPKTLAARLKAAGIVPDANGLFSVSQINRAAFGDFDGETLRLLTAKADIAQHELAIARGEFVNLDEVRAGWAELVIIARSRLLALPGAIASQLTGLTWPAIKSKLDDEIQRALCDVAATSCDTPPTAEKIQNETTKHQNENPTQNENHHIITNTRRAIETAPPAN